MRRSSRQTPQPDSYSHRSDSPLTDDDQQPPPPPPPPQPDPTPHPTASKQRKSSGGGGGGTSKVKQEEPSSGEREPKRKRSASTSTTGTSAGGGGGGGGAEPAGKGAQAALARSGLQVTRDLCETCKDVLVGSHVIIPCRHLLCFDCLFSHLLHIVSSPTASKVIVCPFPDCGQKVTGVGKWEGKDQEVRTRVLALSTSTYAHRSREIRQAMFDRKPSVASFLKAIPAFSHLSYGTIDKESLPPAEAPIHPRTSSSSSSSSNQPLQQQQQQPSSTPSRTLPVPSHQLRTPSQQHQQPSSNYPTPQTETRVAQGQGAGGYPSEQAQAQPPPPQPRRMGSYGEQSSREPGGSERLWVGDLVIPAHGGGQVLVPCEGWTLGSHQPHIPHGLLPHPISLRNFVFVHRIGPISPSTQVLHFRPTTEPNATVRSVSEPQLEQIRRAPGMVEQLCATIVSKGALGIVLPNAPDLEGNAHILFDVLPLGQNHDGSPRYGLIAIVNPDAHEIIARVTGASRIPVQQPHPSHLASPPNVSPQQQIHDYARRQQQSQMQQQQYQSLPPPPPPQQMQDPSIVQYRPPPPLSRVVSDPHPQQQHYHSISPQLGSYHSQPPTPQFRINPTISLPPIPPSSIPPHLQTDSQEFLNFPSASPEPSLPRPSMDSGSELNTEASYYGGDGASMMMREGEGGGEGGGGEGGRVEEGGDQGEFETIEMGGEGGDGPSTGSGEMMGGGGNGGGSGGRAPWRGSMVVRMAGDQENGATRVEFAEGTVHLRSDVHARFDPVLLPNTLDFVASPTFDDQNLQIVGQIDIVVPNPTHHMQVVRFCDSAAEYNQFLLFQITANDYSSPLPSHQNLVLRLRVERGPSEAGGGGESFVADLHLVG